KHRKIVSDYKSKSFVIYDNGTKYTYNNGYFQIDAHFSEEMAKDLAESGGSAGFGQFAEWGETKVNPQYNEKQLKKEYARKSRVKGKDRELDYIPIDIDGDERYLLKPYGKLVKPPIKSITSRYGKGRLSDQQLLHDYQTFDIETGNLQRYASMKKELINRGLLPYEEVNINDYGGNGLDINVK
ncbi:MAG: hypothetical protein LGB05_07885, partial [Sulfurovum sp.]|nr:hypothetical protein [Sulfurovum sp.]